MFSELAKLLEQRGYKSVFVCKTYAAHQEYVRQGRTSFFVSTEIFNKALSIDQEQFRSISDTYGTPSIQSIVDSDVHMEVLFPGDRMSQYAVVASAYMFWESFLDEHAVDYIVCRETATFLTRTAYSTAVKKSIPYGQIMYGPAQGHCLLCDVGELHIWSELTNFVDEGLKVISTKQHFDVDAFVKVRLPDTSKKMALRFVPMSLMQSIRRYLGFIWHDTHALMSTDPIHLATLRYGKQRLMKQVRWKYITQYLFSYDALADGESFAYFPFYSGLETSYLTQTPYWARNEVSLIKEVARKLPVGMFLYVKEHPHNPGDFSYSKLRELQQTSNIKVIQPEVSSQFLIQESKVVVTIQGTAGWEAFLTKKPVVCIDAVAFYALSSLVYVVENISSLEEVLKRAISEGGTHYRSKIDEWYWFIYGVISTMGTGDIVNLIPPYGFVTDRKSVNALAGFIDKTYRFRHSSSVPEEKKEK